MGRLREEKRRRKIVTIPGERLDFHVQNGSSGIIRVGESMIVGNVLSHEIWLFPAIR